MNRRLPRPGDADVGEAALLLHLVGLGQRPAAREHALLGADEEHDGELEALRRVQRHQDDLVLDLPVGQLVGVGDERHLLEELVDAGELVRRPDELVEVLQPPVGLDRVLGLQLGEVAGPFERRLQQFRRARPLVGEAVGERVEQGHERVDAAQRRTADAGLVGAAQGIDEPAAPSSRRSDRACRRWCRRCPAWAR